MTLLAIPLKEDRGMDSLVNAHFSRSPFFLIYDTASGESSVEKNDAATAQGHEGPLNQLFDRGVRSIACSGIGPAAIDYAGELGMSVCFGRGARARELVEKYMGGALESMADGSPCGGT